MNTAGDIILAINSQFVTYLTGTSEKISESYNVCLVNNVQQAKDLLNENSKVERFYEFDTENQEHALALLSESYQVLDVPGRILKKVEVANVDYDAKLILVVHRQEKYTA